jgi:hypothetical protein
MTRTRWRGGAVVALFCALTGLVRSVSACCRLNRVHRRCQMRVQACDTRHQTAAGGSGHRRTAESLRPRLREPTEQEATRLWGSARSTVHSRKHAS